MIKITAVSLVTAALLSAGAAFAGEKHDSACCAAGASNKTACANFEKMNLTADQKTKIEAWQADCMKGGCTEKSRTTFLKKAERILSKDQFAMLKAQCGKPAPETKTKA
jgi:hypothetical protein